MDDLKLCDSDYRFMSVVWESEPVGSGPAGPAVSGPAGLEEVHHLHCAEKAV